MTPCQLQYIVQFQKISIPIQEGLNGFRIEGQKREVDRGVMEKIHFCGAWIFPETTLQPKKDTKWGGEGRGGECQQQNL